MFKFCSLNNTHHSLVVNILYDLMESHAHTLSHIMTNTHTLARTQTKCLILFYCNEYEIKELKNKSYMSIGLRLRNNV